MNDYDDDDDFVRHAYTGGPLPLSTITSHSQSSKSSKGSENIQILIRECHINEQKFKQYCTIESNTTELNRTEEDNKNKNKKKIIKN